MKRRRIYVTLLAMLMLVVLTVSVKALTATPLDGTILGYTYRGRLTITSTAVSASLTSDAEISNEEEEDHPIVRINGAVKDASNGTIAIIMASGVKSCSHSSTYTGGDHGHCNYYVENQYVGILELDLV